MTARHRAAIVVLSHRPEMVGEAVASATHQTVPCQVLVQHSKQNWADKVNRIVEAVDAEWVCVLCDDDLLDLRYIEVCLEHSARADVLYTNRTIFGRDPKDGPNALYWSAPHRTHGQEVKNGAVYAVKHPWASFTWGSPLLMTVLVRKRLWDAHGGYDGHMPHADTEFWYRLIRGSADGTVPPARTVYIDQPLMYYRNHANQLSRTYASFLPFLKAFHWKHFHDFGIILHGGSGTTIPLDPLKLEPIAPHERLAIWATHHHHPQTSAGAMATETAPLTKTQKGWLQLALAKAQRETQEIIDSIMEEAGKLAHDGWSINPFSHEFTREVPDFTPAVNQPVDVPAGTPVVVPALAQVMMATGTAPIDQGLTIVQRDEVPPPVATPTEAAPIDPATTQS